MTTPSAERGSFLCPAAAQGNVQLGLVGSPPAPPPPASTLFGTALQSRRQADGPTITVGSPCAATCAFAALYPYLTQFAANAGSDA
jgi:hypothetical protein